jgi:hypothetical protein
MEATPARNEPVSAFERAAERSPKDGKSAERRPLSARSISRETPDRLLKRDDIRSPKEVEL